ncbi:MULTISPECIES: hypothetical protein [unclassified Exiguobacterium]|uniref:hypothetical protein n=2 Tax=unclassified Exiguobacterium TaxID=2644629 RepID=UPI00203739D2|nr:MULTISPECIES: hypothetical protein [unclassified Exiguobacterium]
MDDESICRYRFLSTNPDCLSGAGNDGRATATLSSVLVPTVTDVSGRPVSAWAMDLASEVTLMSYRTVYGGGNGLSAITLVDTLYAANHQHNLSYALEFTELPETPSITFYGQSRQALNQLVNQTMNSSFPPRAIVYHDFEAYQAFMQNTK